MSEQEYVTVLCRVPKGLLKEGEELEWRHPEPNERFLSTMRPIIITTKRKRFEDWAERNLPKPAGCGLYVSVSDRRSIIYAEEKSGLADKSHSGFSNNIMHGPEPIESDRGEVFYWNANTKRWIWEP